MVITPSLIIINIILFVLVFVFIKTIDTRKWITIPVAIILTPIVYFYVFYPMLNIFSSYHHEKKFYQDNWEETPGLRYEMIDYMKTSGDFIGKSKKETLSLLGKAEWLSWDFDANQFNNNAWNYNLGKLPGAFTSEGKQLEVIFKNDKIDRLNVTSVDLNKEADEE